MKQSCRAYSSKEIEQMIYSRLYAIIMSDNKNDFEKNITLIVKVLNLFEGDDIDIVPFDLFPAPHSGHKKFCKKENENWFEKSSKINLSKFDFLDFIKVIKNESL